ncbi:hypothetical protein OAF47_00030 [bacterium]|nr:hypothetical protein [bacterium]
MIHTIPSWKGTCGSAPEAGVFARFTSLQQKKNICFQSSVNSSLRTARDRGVGHKSSTSL